MTKSSNPITSSPLRAEDLENADHEVLRRLLGSSSVPNSSRSSHMSHASGSGRGHNSHVSSMTPAAEDPTVQG